MTEITQADRKGIPYVLPTDYNLLGQVGRRVVRNEYTRLQDGKCYYCKGPLDEEPPQNIQKKPINWRRFPPNFLKYPHHLHHCHKTGMTIGTVHARCNAVLWQYHGE